MRSGSGRGVPLVELVDARTCGVPRDEWHAYVRASWVPSGGLYGPSSGDRPGFVSRSYCYPWALVARHDAAVGVDIERRDAVGDRDVAFAEATCTPTELDRLRWGAWTSLVDLWSGKEALTKALGDALRYDPRRIDAPCGWGVWSGHVPQPGVIGGIRRRGAWAAARLDLSGEAAQECIGWIVWRLPQAR